MCLYYNGAASKQFKKGGKGFAPRTGHTITVWKEVCDYKSSGGNCITPYRHQEIKCESWIYSDRASHNRLKLWWQEIVWAREICHGIHVWLDLASVHLGCWEGMEGVWKFRYPLIECRANMDDFLGCDAQKEHGVFSRIFATSRIIRTLP